MNNIPSLGSPTHMPLPDGTRLPVVKASLNKEALAGEHTTLKFANSAPHPLEGTIGKLHEVTEKEAIATAFRMHGRGHGQMVEKLIAVSKVPLRGPTLPSSSVSYDIAMGKAHSVDFEDYLPGPFERNVNFCAAMEKRYNM
eukprot:TRINITY_DN9122_c0_g1_i1.p1 TRINITY_DN9122_c0_g1~~TRINITY_DN9122_c0_g1_i1.p1  ORF type:complete len:141 (-),score=20.39 TRINITY_DN9122_c0_g1_i1:34-456(-)